MNQTSQDSAPVASSLSSATSASAQDADDAGLRSDRLLILDFGGQYTQLIARSVRECGVYCEIYPWDVSPQAISDFDANGVILSGGPESVTTQQTPRAASIVFDLGVPVLGICYGMQTMAAQLGGEVESSSHREFGFARVDVMHTSALLDDVMDPIEEDKGNESAAPRGGAGHPATSLEVWMSHGDRVISAPSGFNVVASTEAAPIAAIADESRRFYGVQFHPEVTHTKSGRDILRRFAIDICKTAGAWKPARIIDEIIQRIREQVGQEQVILGLSGGVDSSVTAALLHRAIGDQLTCIFVDNGLLRLNEADDVMETFARHLGVQVVHVDASERFLDKLAGVTDPEAKRKVIGEVFINVFEEQATVLDDARWLAQGTIYPDVIESAGSATGKAKVIKSHHNVGGLPAHMKLALIEPLRDLFKDEVRKVGLELGLDASLIHRHPFPGPGLGVRILGEVTRKFADILRQADAIFIDELRAADWYDKVDQAFVVFIPEKSVGVVGDNRAYEYVVSLRAVQTVDFMTAKSARLPWQLLETVSSRIINEVRGISRVAYDISSKPPATIEWE